MANGKIKSMGKNANQRPMKIKRFDCTRHPYTGCIGSQIFLSHDSANELLLLKCSDCNIHEALESTVHILIRYTSRNQMNSNVK